MAYISTSSTRRFLARPSSVRVAGYRSHEAGTHRLEAAGINAIAGAEFIDHSLGALAAEVEVVVEATDVVSCVPRP